MRLDDILRTPSELVKEALPLAHAAITAVDTTGRLSDLAAAGICLASLKRVAPRFDYEIGDWPAFAASVMRNDLARAIARGECTHPVEQIADLIFGRVK